MLPIWLAAGGNPGSAVRAGTLGLPLALAIIGGNPAQFAPFAELYRRTGQAAGHQDLPLSINSHGFIADSSEEAAEEFFLPMKTMMDRIGRERGWPPMTREQYDASRSLEGANFIGSPEDVIEKILHQHKIFNHDRFLVQFTVGTLPHDKVLRSIELFGTVVAPAVREALAHP
jgi:alkanesulfonate monooxygenase SsuD/methylene tetrahydromethanopterin reductase-like flavin-dependent oxidoreductase (luciferase family)